MKRNAYYSVIQYMPDLGRAEACNIGVLIWVPETKQCHHRQVFGFGWQRVTRFFRRADTEIIDLDTESEILRLKHAAKDWETVEDFTKYVESLANQIQMTAPRPITLSGTDNAERDRLYFELVSEPRP